MHIIELKNSLKKATQLVSKLIAREISLNAFIKEYNNFYYYEALDGHEADEVFLIFLEENELIIKLYEEIQTQVLDHLYQLDDQQDHRLKEQYEQAGRIDEKIAINRINEIGKKYDIDKLIDNFNT